MLSIIVGRANGVSLRVRELAQGGIPIPSLLVEQGGRHAAKPVPGHFRAAPAELPQSAVDRVLAHAPLAAACARKDVVPFAGQWLQRAQDGHRLARQRHDVLRLSSSCAAALWATRLPQDRSRPTRPRAARQAART